MAKQTIYSILDFMNTFSSKLTKSLSKFLFGHGIVRLVLFFDNTQLLRMVAKGCRLFDISRPIHSRFCLWQHNEKWIALFPFNRRKV